MTRAITLAAVLLAAAPAPADQPQGLTNARVETRTAAASLGNEIRAILSARREPLWIGYVVPTTERHQACCWSSTDEAGSGCCGGCRLESPKGENAFRPEGRSPIALEGSARLRVLVRAEGGRILRLRTVSEDCGLDVGGLPFVWLEGVRPADSVAWLSTLLEQPSFEKSESALAAIAFHADPSADAALERWVAADQPLKRRRQAAFWLGQARGARGRDVLIRLLRQDGDPKLREHAIFSLSQSREAGAVDAIIEAAKKDENAHVRGQALFWLAQTAAKRAPAVIKASLDQDPEVEVKKKAVFALSQLPKEEGVPLLIGLARTHRSPEVRKQAMFWLGQSGDPRALSFFEEVLKR
jgi:hypothetical protein